MSGVSGSLGQAPDLGSRGRVPAKRIKGKCKGGVVVRDGSDTSPHSPGESNKKILLDLMPTLY